MWNIKKFLAVRRVWAWWPFASVVLTIRFPIMWLGNVWEPAPPPRSTGLSRLFNPPLSGLNTHSLRHVAVSSSCPSRTSYYHRLLLSLILLLLITDVANWPVTGVEPMIRSSRRPDWELVKPLSVQPLPATGRQDSHRNNHLPGSSIAAACLSLPLLLCRPTRGQGPFLKLHARVCKPSWC